MDTTYFEITEMDNGEKAVSFYGHKPVYCWHGYPVVVDGAETRDGKTFVQILAPVNLFTTTKRGQEVPCNFTIVDKDELQPLALDADAETALENWKAAMADSDSLVFNEFPQREIVAAYQFERQCAEQFVHTFSLLPQGRQ